MPIYKNTMLISPWIEQSGRTDISFREILNMAEDFFMEKGDVYETMFRLARRLDEENIQYAIIGGMAIAAHGYTRLTLDVDVLLTPEGLRTFREQFIGRGYVPAFAGALKSFLDTASKIRIKFITAGEFPGDGLPKPVAFPDPTGKTVELENIRFIKLENLIELKLASGMTAPHRLRDLADVQELIIALDLPLELMEKLDESVAAEYRRLWEAAQQGKRDSEKILNRG